MRIVFLLACLLALPAGATDVYRWVDSAGQAHYSDQWQPGAEKIRIEESSRYSAPKPVASTSSSTAGKQAALARYQSLEITSPAQEEVLWNVAGQVRVSLQPNPALQPGHHLRIQLDGTTQDLAEGSSSVQLEDVYRGVHTLVAQVVDAKGTVLVESEPTTFVVRQTSVEQPQAEPGGGTP